MLIYDTLPRLHMPHDATLSPPPIIADDAAAIIYAKMLPCCCLLRWFDYFAIAF